MNVRRFGDLQIGQQILVGTYTAPIAEAIDLARRWEPQPYHVDERAARESIYGELTLCSLHLFAICTRLFFDMGEPIDVLGMLGKEGLRLPAPARPGEELRYHTECIEKRESKTRADRGVVVLHDRLQRSDGTVVLEQKVTLLVRR